MSYFKCGTRANSGNFGFETYRGGDNVTYRIASKKTINIPYNLEQVVGTIEAEQYGGQNSVLAMGVVLNSQGSEVFRFYPQQAGVTTDAYNTIETVTDDSADAEIPAGDYTVMNFQLVDGFNTFGTSIICISGEEQVPVTPVPETPVPTPEPTVTPTPTAVTPTPSPTPVPTATPIPFNPVPSLILPLGPQYTLSYSEGSEGWPSFYSYSPDYMVGMNNYFYSFSGGNIYRHNTNEIRNNYYGVQYDSSITTVMNESPFDNKIFKTLSLESDQAWRATITTDMNDQAFINSTWFEQKEGAWYAAIKNTTQAPTVIDNFNDRSINGIGRCLSWSGSLNTGVTFSFSAETYIDSIISIGDFLYFNNESNNTPGLVGKITSITSNQIIAVGNITGSNLPTTINPLMIAVKNNTAESHGVLGHYATIQLEHTGSAPTELFAIESQVMKSYP